MEVIFNMASIFSECGRHMFGIIIDGVCSLLEHRNSNQSTNRAVDIDNNVAKPVDNAVGVRLKNDDRLAVAEDRGNSLIDRDLASPFLPEGLIVRRNPHDPTTVNISTTQYGNELQNTMTVDEFKAICVQLEADNMKKQQRMEMYRKIRSRLAGYPMIQVAIGSFYLCTAGFGVFAVRSEMKTGYLAKKTTGDRMLHGWLFAALFVCITYRGLEIITFGRFPPESWRQAYEESIFRRRPEAPTERPLGILHEDTISAERRGEAITKTIPGFLPGQTSDSNKS